MAQKTGHESASSRIPRCDVAKPTEFVVQVACFLERDCRVRGCHAQRFDSVGLSRNKALSVLNAVAKPMRTSFDKNNAVTRPGVVKIRSDSIYARTLARLVGQIRSYQFFSDTFLRPFALPRSWGSILRIAWRVPRTGIRTSLDFCASVFRG
jgi:hypothetical protein